MLSWHPESGGKRGTSTIAIQWTIFPLNHILLKAYFCCAYFLTFFSMARKTLKIEQPRWNNLGICKGYKPHTVLSILNIWKKSQKHFRRKFSSSEIFENIFRFQNLTIMTKLIIVVEVKKDLIFYKLWISNRKIFKWMKLKKYDRVSHFS